MRRRVRRIPHGKEGSKMITQMPTATRNVDAEFEKRTASVSDLGDIFLVRCLLNQLRREELEPDLRTPSRDENLQKFLQLRDQMMQDLGVKEACLVRNELLLVRLPLSAQVFYYRSADSTICRIGPFLTSDYNAQELEYFLRDAGLSSTEQIHAIFRSYPVQSEEQVQQMSWLLSKALGKETVVVDARNYRCRTRKTYSPYEAVESGEQRKRIDKTSEEAEKIIGKICFEFRSGKQKAVAASAADFASLVLKNRNNKDLLLVLRNYLQEGIAQICTSQFEKTRSRQFVLLLSTFMARIHRLESAEDMIHLQHDFLEQAWNLTKPAEKRAIAHDRRMLDVMEYIRSHYAEKLTLQQLADRAGLSTSYLSGHFARETGLTISSYVRRTRIDHAKLMLRYMTLPVTEVAYQCGYQDVSYFIKEFRKEVGCSPLEYRKNEIDLTSEAEAGSL